jgi:hypothetical protein
LADQLPDFVSDRSSSGAAVQVSVVHAETPESSWVRAEKQ